jgi:hypothetical protein
MPRGIGFEREARGETKTDLAECVSQNTIVKNDEHIDVMERKRVPLTRVARTKGSAQISGLQSVRDTIDSDPHSTQKGSLRGKPEGPRHHGADPMSRVAYGTTTIGVVEVRKLWMHLLVDEQQSASVTQCS